MTYTANDLDSMMNSSPYDESREVDSSDYLKPSDLTETPTKFRILTKAFNYWTTWTKNPNDEKSTYTRTKTKPNPLPANIKRSFNNKPDVYYYDCYVIWNYDLEKYQILEIKQISIKNELNDFAMDKAYGNFIKYDLSMSKKGKGTETEYSVKAPPMFNSEGKRVEKTITKEELLEKMNYAKENIYLPALFTSDDPFNCIKPEEKKNSNY
jgi:hypothetical protein